MLVGLAASATLRRSASFRVASFQAGPPHQGPGLRAGDPAAPGEAATADATARPATARMNETVRTRCQDMSNPPLETTRSEVSLARPVAQRNDRSAGSRRWRVASTPAKRSPCSRIRSSTTSIVNEAGSSDSSTSSQRSGVETEAPAVGRTE